MNKRTIAKSYWRSIKRGTKTFDAVPSELKPYVKDLAGEDVRNGVITPEQYEAYIGAPYGEAAV